MRRFRYKLLGLAGCVAPLVWSCVAPACNVPVFRYALERWEADRYPIVVFHSDPLTPTQQALLKELEEGGPDGPANVAVSRVDLTQELPPSLGTLWRAQQNPKSPWMVIRYPEQTGIEASVRAGPLEAEAAKSLVESPARRAIAQKLLSGDAIVWLLLEGEDEGRNEAFGRLVEAELGKLEKSLVLPERTPADPPINPELPLRIAFSLVRVARSDPGERTLVNVLLSWSTNLIAAREPMLFPIFGRGRVIAPAIGEEIRPEALREMAEFLTGPCSCEVKALNPGYDLLLAANWATVPAYQETAVPSASELVGMSQFAADAATNSAVAPRPVAVSLAAAHPSAAPVARPRLWRNLGILLGSGVLVLAATTLVLKARASRKPR